MVYMPPVSPFAKLKVGDYVASSGIYSTPGVVSEITEDGNVVVDTSKEAIQRFHKHTVTNGLNPEDKIEFNEIMDDIVGMENDKDKMEALADIITELKGDPEKKALFQELKGQQAELVRLTERLPHVYSVDYTELR